MSAGIRWVAGSCLIGIAALLASGCTSSTSSGGPASPAFASGVPASAGGTSAASGGSGSAGSGSGAVAVLSDACSLLTQAEVSSALGKPVGPGIAQDGSKSCAWEYTSSNGAIQAQASIDIEDSSFDKLCNVPSNAALGITMTQLTGVGDKACLAELTGVLPVLTFEKGGHVLSTSVGLGNVPPATSEAAEKALAIAAAARI